MTNLPDLLIINNLEFAQKQQKLSDSFAVSNCKRLLETLALHDNNLQKSAIYFELIGDYKQFRQPSLHLRIKTNLPVICQRCLDEMSINLDLNLHYLISNTALNEYDESDEIDWLEASPDMNLLELIEDELLLAMPISPMHDNNCAKTSTQSGEKPNPFAVLQALKAKLK